MNADRVTIESDERGFELHVMDENGDWHIYNIHAIAEDVYDEVKRSIGPWLQERDNAKASFDRGEGPNGEPAYRCVDPEGDWIEEQRRNAAFPSLEQMDLMNKARKENP